MRPELAHIEIRAIDHGLEGFHHKGEGPVEVPENMHLLYPSGLAKIDERPSLWVLHIESVFDPVSQEPSPFVSPPAVEPSCCELRGD